MMDVGVIPILVIIFIRKFGNCSTLTAPVEFDKCISAIKENAFVASQYPVIITLEDHLTSNLQKKAAEVCYKFFLSWHPLFVFFLNEAA
jgi:hypothetical protein